MLSSTLLLFLLCSNSHLLIPFHLSLSLSPHSRLVLLDEYLQDFTDKEVDTTVKFQTKFKVPRRMEVPFPISEGMDAKHMITVNWLLNEEALSAKETFALAVLDQLLIGTSSASLKKALVESNLGESVTGGGLSDELLQSTFSAGLKGVKAEDVGKVEELVMFELAKLSSTGFEQTAVDAVSDVFALFCVVMVVLSYCLLFFLLLHVPFPPHPRNSCLLFFLLLPYVPHSFLLTFPPAYS
jgi:hypothetical protein